MPSLNNFKNNILYWKWLDGQHKCGSIASNEARYGMLNQSQRLLIEVEYYVNPHHRPLHTSLLPLLG